MATAENTSAANQSFADAHAAWHETAEADRRSPHGPLSSAALHWLTKEPSELPGIPGVWSADDSGTVTVELGSDDGITRGGEPLSGTVTLGPYARGQEDILEWGEKRLQVAPRVGHIIVRTQDPESPTRLNYEGTNTFPANEKWRITAHFEPAERAAVEVDSAVEGAKQHFDSPGRAVFEIDGQEYSLTLFGKPDATDLRVHFVDETGKDLTYPAVRFAEATRDGDEVVIDFNRAINPPCAYTTFATCPFAPPENRLPVRVEAGELRPGVSL